MALVEKILVCLQRGTEATAKIFDFIISSPRDAFRKTYRAYPSDEIRFETDWAQWYRERQQFYAMLSYLKREGLIAGKKIPGRRGSLWRITQKGLARLAHVQKQEANPFSLRNISYEKSEKPAAVIVTFDIPELEEMKRRWLRECLKRFGYAMLQRSVWLGKTALPEDFLRDLRKKRMVGYVHIFSVERRGTIRELV